MTGERGDNAIHTTSLEALTRSLPAQLVRGDGRVSVTDITEDSREVRPGSLFVARRGAKLDGRRFVPAAIAAGAVAVLSDDPGLDTGAAALLFAADVATTSAVLAERFFGDPSSKLTLIGVTGTNGKTTTACLVQQIFESAGRRCGLIGTIHIDDGCDRVAANLTTPSAIEISRTLARMVANGLTSCVMEASSHALEQGRTAGLRFAGAIFTNLTGDHLDYHGTMDAYAESKAKLFDSMTAAGFAIVNVDDPVSERMLRDCAARTIIRCSPSGESNRDAWARPLEWSAQATRVDLSGPWGMLEITLPLVGRHNVANALHAAAAAFAAGVPAEEIGWALMRISAPPGRLEPVTAPDHPFAVFVDYAHTDDALVNVLGATRPIVPQGGRLIVVFGCGGDRDRTKRPRMARAAMALADLVAITSDNPRTEEPQAIINDILSGVADSDRPRLLLVEADRRRAIEQVIEQARGGDIIVIAGKGHEDYQIIGTVKRHFDDREVARLAIAQRSAPPTSSRHSSEVAGISS